MRARSHFSAGTTPARAASLSLSRALEAELPGKCTAGAAAAAGSAPGTGRTYGSAARSTELPPANQVSPPAARPPPRPTHPSA